MQKLLCKIERVFFFKDLGLVIEPGITALDSKVMVGAKLLLVRPDGSELRTTVASIPLGLHDLENGIPILLSKEVEPADAPLGTMVYQLDSERS